MMCQRSSMDTSTCFWFRTFGAKCFDPLSTIGLAKTGTALPPLLFATIGELECITFSENLHSREPKKMSLPKKSWLFPLLLPQGQVLSLCWGFWGKTVGFPKSARKVLSKFWLVFAVVSNKPPWPFACFLIGQFVSLIFLFKWIPSSGIMVSTLTRLWNKGSLLQFKDTVFISGFTMKVLLFK